MHGIHRSGEPVVDEVAQHLVPDGAPMLPRSDDGNRAGRDEPRDRASLGHVLALVHGLECGISLEDAHLDRDDAVGKRAVGLEPCSLEDREHPAILRKHLGGETRDAVRTSDDREMLEQHCGDAAPLVLVVDGERNLRLATARPLVVARDPDEVVAEQRHERHAVVVVDSGETPDVVGAQPRPRAEEPVVHALMRQATVERNESVGVRGTHRTDVHGPAVAEHDIGFPLRRVAAFDRRRLGAHTSERTERRSRRSGTSVTRSFDVDDDAAHHLVVPGLSLLVPQR